MYRALAAYALALLLTNPELWISARHRNGTIVWFIDKTAGVAYHYHRTYKLSIHGAMRAAQEVFDTDARAYNTLDQRARHYARITYNKSIVDLDYKECCDTLKHVAAF